MCGPEGKQEGETWVKFVVKARSVFHYLPASCLQPSGNWETEWNMEVGESLSKPEAAVKGSLSKLGVADTHIFLTAYE